MAKDTYTPREDTFLLADVVMNYCEDNMKVLEVGVGSSYILNQVSEKYRVTTFATDLNKNDVHNSRKSGHRAVVSSTASCFTEGSLDMIFFNFPYLESLDEFNEEYTERALSYTDGLMEEYLKNSERCLQDSGYSIFLVSDKTPINIEEQIGETDLSLVDKTEKSLFFEKLQVYVTRNSEP